MNIVVWKGCSNCSDKTDLFCVVCDTCFCEICTIHCVQCQQPVCQYCYREDACCLQRPWGEKTERHFRDFYENKICDARGFVFLEKEITEGEGNGSQWNQYRKDVARLSVHDVFENFDTRRLMHNSTITAKYVPKLSKFYKEDEGTRSKFLEFMKQMAWYRFFSSLLFIFYSYSPLLLVRLYFPKCSFIQRTGRTLF